MAWQQILIQIAIVIAAAVFTPRPPRPQDAIREGLDTPTPQPGRNTRALFGKNWVKNPALFYVGNKDEIAVKKKGGK